MYKIAVSPEQLDSFANKIEEFKKIIAYECNCLMQQANAIIPLVDQATGNTIVRPAIEITNVVNEWEKALFQLSENAHSYASKIRIIQQRICNDSQASSAKQDIHNNTFKEKACATVCATVMHEYIKASDSEYQTMGGYLIAKTNVIKGTVDGLGQIVNNLSGQSTTPSIPIDGVVDDIIKTIDFKLSTNPSIKTIDRSATPIPKEQVNSHTLTIDDAKDPWKISN